MILPKTRVIVSSGIAAFHRLSNFGLHSLLMMMSQHRSVGSISHDCPSRWALLRPTASTTALHTFDFNHDGDGFGITAVASVVVVAVFALLLATLYLYRRAIVERLRKLNEDSLLFGLNVQMERIKDASAADSAVFSDLQLMELNDAFRAKHDSAWQLMSLGEYMSSLKPKAMPNSVTMEDVPKIIQSELEAALSAALLKAMGPSLGRAFLPATGLPVVNSQTRALAMNLAARAAAASTTTSTKTERIDRSGLPINLMSLLAISDVNAKVQEMARVPGDEHSQPVNKKPGATAIGKMKLGEVGFPVDCSFAPAIPIDKTQPLVTSPFRMETDFSNTIAAMEDRMRESKTSAGDMSDSEGYQRGDVMNEIGATEEPSVEEETEYNPNGRSLSKPVPINPRLLPDLHFGWGAAECTSTNREVLQNRLMSVLLNRLGSNHYRIANEQDEDLFVVQMNDKDIATPGDLVQALADSGHKVTSVVTTHVTTFGIAMSIKEDDGSWTNIPLACFLDSGYEDARGNMAPTAMPHSGLNLQIRGPLLGNSRIDIQHYIAIDGFCGWYTNHSPNVPWIKDISCGEPVTGSDAVRAARIAALYAVSLNGLATEKNLPFGGYGLTAVCNDSAAAMEQCLQGTSSIYPMTSIGTYMMRTVRYAAALREKFRTVPNKEQEVKDLTDILRAIGQIPSDLNAAPNKATNVAQRILHGIPEDPVFEMMVHARNVMYSILKEEAMDEVAAKSTSTSTVSRK